VLPFPTEGFGGVTLIDNRNAPQGERDIFAQLVGINDVTPPVIINQKVSFVVQSTSFNSTTVSGGPSGVFTITANLTNTSQEDIPGLIEAFVSALTNGNVLLTATDGDGSVGSKQAINVGSDNKLSPNESVTVQFKIGLANRNPFVFLVDVTATQ
jgi:hypothetical protein